MWLLILGVRRWGEGRGLLVCLLVVRSWGQESLETEGMRKELIHTNKYDSVSGESL